MADIKDCCPTDVQPVTSDYKGAGKMEKLKVGDEEIDMYVTGEGKKGIIHVYDIFGYHPNAFQVADLVAKKGTFAF
jgi:hypothetical protein